MMSNKIFRLAFVSLVITGVINFIAIKFYLYWTVWWIDMVAHFFGGVTVAFAVVWLLSVLFDVNNWSTKKLFFTTILSGILVGILWEFYELYFDITSLSDGIKYYTDTASDLIMDTIGSIFSFLVVKNILNK